MKIDIVHIGEALTLGIKIVEQILAVQALQKIGDTADLPPVRFHLAGKHLELDTTAKVIP